MVRLHDLPDYPELMAQGSLGHLMTSGFMERFVKFHPGSEERKAKALAWLTSIRTGGAHCAPLCFFPFGKFEKWLKIIEYP